MPKGNFKTLASFEGDQACQLCDTNRVDDFKLGKIHKLADIIVHYFCLLMSSQVEQNGTDRQGILGFFPKDIKKEIVRGSTLTCYYCKKKGATITCSSKHCSRTFHLPCGIDKGSIHQFFDTFKSFCSVHPLKQKIPQWVRKNANDLCIVCTCSVSTKKQCNYLWPSCCKAEAFFHRTCIQKLACSAGYYFKCPLCNNTREFQAAMRFYGIYIPEQEAVWETEPNAYEELLVRPQKCEADLCCCPRGRMYSKKNTYWQFEVCRTCGSSGIHLKCCKTWDRTKGYILNWNCYICSPVIQTLHVDEKNQKISNNNNDGFTSPNSPLINVVDSDDEVCVTIPESSSVVTASSNESNVLQIPCARVLSDSENEEMDVANNDLMRRRKRQIAHQTNMSSSKRARTSFELREENESLKISTTQLSENNRTSDRRLNTLVKNDQMKPVINSQSAVSDSIQSQVSDESEEDRIIVNDMDRNRCNESPAHHVSQGYTLRSKSNALHSSMQGNTRVRTTEIISSPVTVQTLGTSYSKTNLISCQNNVLITDTNGEEKQLNSAKTRSENVGCDIESVSDESLKRKGQSSATICCLKREKSNLGECNPMESSVSNCHPLMLVCVLPTPTICSFKGIKCNNKMKCLNDRSVENILLEKPGSSVVCSGDPEVIDSCKTICSSDFQDVPTSIGEVSLETSSTLRSENVCGLTSPVKIGMSFNYNSHTNYQITAEYLNNNSLGIDSHSQHCLYKSNSGSSNVLFPNDGTSPVSVTNSQHCFHTGHFNSHEIDQNPMLGYGSPNYNVKFSCAKTQIPCTSSCVHSDTLSIGSNSNLICKDNKDQIIGKKSEKTIYTIDKDTNPGDQTFQEACRCLATSYQNLVNSKCHCFSCNSCTHLNPINSSTITNVTNNDGKSHITRPSTISENSKITVNSDCKNIKLTSLTPQSTHNSRDSTLSDIISLEHNTLSLPNKKSYHKENMCNCTDCQMLQQPEQNYVSSGIKKQTFNISIKNQDKMCIPKSDVPLLEYSHCTNSTHVSYSALNELDNPGSKVDLKYNSSDSPIMADKQKSLSRPLSKNDVKAETSINYLLNALTIGIDHQSLSNNPRQIDKFSCDLSTLYSSSASQLSVLNPQNFSLCQTNSSLNITDSKPSMSSIVTISNIEEKAILTKGKNHEEFLNEYCNDVILENAPMVQYAAERKQNPKPKETDSHLLNLYSMSFSTKLDHADTKFTLYHANKEIENFKNSEASNDNSSFKKEREPDELFDETISDRQPSSIDTIFQTNQALNALRSISNVSINVVDNSRNCPGSPLKCPIDKSPHLSDNFDSLSSFDRYSSDSLPDCSSSNIESNFSKNCGIKIEKRKNQFTSSNKQRNIQTTPLHVESQAQFLKSNKILPDPSYISESHSFKKEILNDLIDFNTFQIGKLTKQYENKKFSNQCDNSLNHSFIGNVVPAFPVSRTSDIKSEPDIQLNKIPINSSSVDSSEIGESIDQSNNFDKLSCSSDVKFEHEIQLSKLHINSSHVESIMLKNCGTKDVEKQKQSMGSDKQINLEAQPFHVMSQTVYLKANKIKSDIFENDSDKDQVLNDLIHSGPCQVANLTRQYDIWEPTGQCNNSLRQSYIENVVPNIPISSTSDIKSEHDIQLTTIPTNSSNIESNIFFDIKDVGKQLMSSDKQINLQTPSPLHNMLQTPYLSCSKIQTGSSLFSNNQFNREKVLNDLINSGTLQVDSLTTQNEIRKPAGQFNNSANDSLVEKLETEVVVPFTFVIKSELGVPLNNSKIPINDLLNSKHSPKIILAENPAMESEVNKAKLEIKCPQTLRRLVGSFILSLFNNFDSFVELSTVMNPLVSESSSNFDPFIKMVQLNDLEKNQLLISTNHISLGFKGFEKPVLPAKFQDIKIYLNKMISDFSHKPNPLFQQSKKYTNVKMKANTKYNKNVKVSNKRVFQFKKTIIKPKGELSHLNCESDRNCFVNDFYFPVAPKGIDKVCPTPISKISNQIVPNSFNCVVLLERLITSKLKQYSISPLDLSIITRQKSQNTSEAKLHHSCHSPGNSNPSHKSRTLKHINYAHINHHKKTLDDNHTKKKKNSSTRGSLKSVHCIKKSLNRKPKGLFAPRGLKKHFVFSPLVSQYSTCNVYSESNVSDISASKLLDCSKSCGKEGNTIVSTTCSVDANAKPVWLNSVIQTYKTQYEPKTNNVITDVFTLPSTSNGLLNYSSIPILPCVEHIDETCYSIDKVEQNSIKSNNEALECNKIESRDQFKRNLCWDKIDELTSTCHNEKEDSTTVAECGSKHLNRFDPFCESLFDDLNKFQEKDRQEFSSENVGTVLTSVSCGITVESSFDHIDIAETVSQESNTDNTELVKKVMSNDPFLTEAFINEWEDEINYSLDAISANESTIAVSNCESNSEQFEIGYENLDYDCSNVSYGFLYQGILACGSSTSPSVEDPFESPGFKQELSTNREISNSPLTLRNLKDNSCPTGQPIVKNNFSVPNSNIIATLSCIPFTTDGESNSDLAFTTENQSKISTCKLTKKNIKKSNKPFYKRRVNANRKWNFPPNVLKDNFRLHKRLVDSSPGVLKAFFDRKLCTCSMNSSNRCSCFTNHYRNKKHYLLHKCFRFALSGKQHCLVCYDNSMSYFVDFLCTYFINKENIQLMCEENTVEYFLNHIYRLYSFGCLRSFIVIVISGKSSVTYNDDYFNRIGKIIKLMPETYIIISTLPYQKFQNEHRIAIKQFNNRLLTVTGTLQIPCLDVNEKKLYLNKHINY